jgi:hypothetical protein
MQNAFFLIEKAGMETVSCVILTEPLKLGNPCISQVVHRRPSAVDPEGSATWTVSAGTIACPQGAGGASPAVLRLLLTQSEVPGDRHEKGPEHGQPGPVCARNRVLGPAASKRSLPRCAARRKRPRAP